MDSARALERRELRLRVAERGERGSSTLSRAANAKRLRHAPTRRSRRDRLTIGDSSPPIAGASLRRGGRGKVDLSSTNAGATLQVRAVRHEIGVTEPLADGERVRRIVEGGIERARREMASDAGKSR